VKHIQVYAPTSSQDDSEADNLYENNSDILNNNNTQFTIVMGDFNAKIGNTEGGQRSNWSIWTWS